MKVCCAPTLSCVDARDELNLILWFSRHRKIWTTETENHGESATTSSQSETTENAKTSPTYARSRIGTQHPATQTVRNRCYRWRSDAIRILWNDSFKYESFVWPPSVSNGSLILFCFAPCVDIAKGLDNSRMFAIWRVPAPWQPLTKKGQGQRMGGGKGAIDHYVTPVRAGRVIIEVGGTCEFQEVMNSFLFFEDSSPKILWEKSVRM